MRRALRLLLFSLLFLAAGLPELCASLQKTRVGKFFAPSLDARPGKTLQVLQLPLEDSALCDETASGRLFWSMFDPEGLTGWGLPGNSAQPDWYRPRLESLNQSVQIASDGINAAGDFSAGAVYGYSQVAGSNISNARPENSAQAWGMRFGRAAGTVQATGEIAVGGMLAAGGGALAPVTGGSSAIGVTAGVGMAAHGLNSLNNLRNLEPVPEPDSAGGGSAPEPSAGGGQAPNQGNSGGGKSPMTREERWQELSAEGNLSKQETEHIRRHGGKGMQEKFGKELAHKPGKSAAQGNGYEEAVPKTSADHRGIQHRYLKERTTGTTISVPKRPSRPGAKLNVPPPGSLP